MKVGKYLDQADKERLYAIERDSATIERAVEPIVHLCCSNIPVRVAALFLYNRRRDTLDLMDKSVAGYDSKAKHEWNGIKSHRSYLGMIGHSFHKRKVVRRHLPADVSRSTVFVVLLTDRLSVDRQDPLYLDAIDKRDDRVPISVICLPLISHRQKLGVLQASLSLYRMTSPADPLDPQLVDKLNVDLSPSPLLHFKMEDDDVIDALASYKLVSDAADDEKRVTSGRFTEQDEEAEGNQEGLNAV